MKKKMKEKKQYFTNPWFTIALILTVLLIVSVSININQANMVYEESITKRPIDLELYWNLSHERNSFLRLYDLTILPHSWVDWRYYAEIGQMQFRNNKGFYSGLDRSKVYNVTLHIDKFKLTDIIIKEDR